VGAEQRGYDGGKKVKGRKRHILLVDTEGLVLRAKVMSAKVMDYEKESRRYCIEPSNDFLVFVICGWTRATEQRTRARTGSKRRWVGAWIWWSLRRSPLPKRC
jgi:hypothetical protein